MMSLSSFFTDTRDSSSGGGMEAIFRLPSTTEEEEEDDLNKAWEESLSLLEEGSLFWQVVADTAAVVEATAVTEAGSNGD